MQQVINYITTHWVLFGFAILYLCNVILGHRSQLDSWVTKHPKVGGVLKVIRGALPCDPWLIIQGLSLLVRGTLPAKFAPIANAINTPTAELPPIPEANNIPPAA